MKKNNLIFTLEMLWRCKLNLRISHRILKESPHVREEPDPRASFQRMANELGNYRSVMGTEPIMGVHIR